jgi:hypothetical protein
MSHIHNTGHNNEITTLIYDAAPGLGPFCAGGSVPLCLLNMRTCIYWDLNLSITNSVSASLINRKTDSPGIKITTLTLHIHTNLLGGGGGGAVDYRIPVGRTFLKYNPKNSTNIKSIV